MGEGVNISATLVVVCVWNMNDPLYVWEMQVYALSLLSEIEVEEKLPPATCYVI